MISFLSQMWLPLVSTCTPAANSSRATSGVTPKPPAAFSALAMTQSTPRSRTSRGTWRATVLRHGSPMMSPMKRILISTRPPRPRRDAAFARISLRDVCKTTFADNRDLDLAGICQLLLDLAGQVAGQDGAFRVRDRVLLHDHPDLPPGLDGISLLHSLVVYGQLLQLLEALDVGLDGLPPRPRPRRRERFCGRHQHRFGTDRLDLLVVRSDGVDHPGLLPVFLGEVRADDGVRAFLLLAQRLAHVMHQGPTP